MLKIVVIANYLTGQIFSLTDFIVKTVGTGSEALTLLNQLRQEGADSFFITEDLAQPIQPELKKLRLQDNLMILVIPGVNTGLNLGEKMLAELKRKVVGV